MRRLFPYFPGRGAVHSTSHGNTVTDDMTLLSWRVANPDATQSLRSPAVLREVRPEAAGPHHH